jgi:hypothetical protein
MSKEHILIIILAISIVGVLFFLRSLLYKFMMGKEEKKMQLWLGRNKNDLLTSWGAPTSAFPIENGKQLWSYQSIGQTSGYAHKVSDTHTHIEAPRQYTIKREFFIDENGKIYNYRLENF